MAETPLPPAPFVRRRPGDYLVAIAGTLLAIPLAMLAQRWAGLADLSLVFMLAVLVVASRTHTGPAVLTAVSCFLAYNFFFIEPRYTLYIGAWQGVATVLLFLAAALLAGRLASRLAMQVQALRIAHHHASARRDLAEQLAVLTDDQAVADAVGTMFRRHLDADAWLRLRDGAEAPMGLRRVGASTSVTEWTATTEEHGWRFLPLSAAGEVLGTVGIRHAGPPGMPDDDLALAHAMAADIGQALLRIRLAADLQAARIANETERLRSALLSSVSHDLRTPLAAIIGAAGSLESYGDAMDEADRHALLDTIRGEGERLDRHIQNLLDMTRLGQGGLVLERDWIGIDELVGSAIGRLRRYRPDTRLATEITTGMPPIWVHPALVEQALFNVLENASTFSPEGAAVCVRAVQAEGRACIEVEDRGPGIPDAEREQVFDMFYSVGRGERGRDGTGLGLAICRGMIRAHGGEVQARPGDGGRGTCIRIELPLLQPEPTP